MENELYLRIYDKDVLEFLTVSTEFCVRMEQTAGTELRELVGTLLKILPLLYVKALVLDNSVPEAEGEAEQLVTETDYEYVRTSVSQVLGAYDDYLDVFVEDMKYSDRPVRSTISENLADIYQDLRNFAGIYKQGYPEAMQVALWDVSENFKMYWGQRLVNVMRPLHEIYLSLGEEA